MIQQQRRVHALPAIVWGPETDKVYIYVHGRYGSKEDAGTFADIAAGKGFQTISFDLAQHGERKGEREGLTIENGIRDLSLIYDFAIQNWNRISFFGCSIGAYIGLVILGTNKLEKALLYSPVIDMERLIQNMMRYCNVSEKELMDRQEIPTPFGETLSWEYYTFVKDHPIKAWNTPTEIIYGTKDELTECEAIHHFSNHYTCNTTFIDGAEHYFQKPEDLAALNTWMIEHI